MGAIMCVKQVRSLEQFLSVALLLSLQPLGTVFYTKCQVYQQTQCTLKIENQSITTVLSVRKIYRLTSTVASTWFCNQMS